MQPKRKPRNSSDIIVALEGSSSDTKDDGPGRFECDTKGSGILAG